MTTPDTLLLIGVATVAFLLGIATNHLGRHRPTTITLGPPTDFQRRALAAAEADDHHSLFPRRDVRLLTEVNRQLAEIAVATGLSEGEIFNRAISYYHSILDETDGNEPVLVTIVHT